MLHGRVFVMKIPSKLLCNLYSHLTAPRRCILMCTSVSQIRDTDNSSLHMNQSVIMVTFPFKIYTKLSPYIKYNREKSEVGIKKIILNISPQHLMLYVSLTSHLTETHNIWFYGELSIFFIKIIPFFCLQ